MGKGKEGGGGYPLPLPLTQAWRWLAAGPPQPPSSVCPPPCPPPLHLCCPALAPVPLTRARLPGRARPPNPQPRAPLLTRALRLLGGEGVQAGGAGRIAAASTGRREVGVLCQGAARIPRLRHLQSRGGAARSAAAWRTTGRPARLWYARTAPAAAALQVYTTQRLPWLSCRAGCPVPALPTFSPGESPWNCGVSLDASMAPMHVSTVKPRRRDSTCGWSGGGVTGDDQSIVWAAAGVAAGRRGECNPNLYSPSRPAASRSRTF